MIFRFNINDYMKKLNNLKLACLQINNSEGTWVKMDKESAAHYCHDQEGEAWSLACGPDGIVYLQHELEGVEEAGGDRAGPFGLGSTPSSSAKGFDFTTAEQTPSFAGFGTGGQGMCNAK